MTSNKPYFIRALYDWILDNTCTPYIIVDATLPFVEVPEQFISEGRIVLNILPSATHNLIIDDEWISFSARFGGISESINIPIGAVSAIFAHENGEGMGFETEALPLDYFDETFIKIPSKTSTTTQKSTRPGPKLDVIDSNHAEKDDVIDSSHKDSVNPSGDLPPTKGKKGKKPSLTIVK